GPTTAYRSLLRCPRVAVHGTPFLRKTSRLGRSTEPDGNLHMHPYSAKKSRPGGPPCDVGEDVQEVLPNPIGQQGFHPFRSPLPRRASFFELRHAAGGDSEPLLAAVVPGPDRDPTGVHEGAEIAAQGGLVVQRQLAQISLPDFAGPAKQLEQRVLG